ncbi:MAG: sulfatase-like hydrolase/transferase, partial [Planctomycetales bacterium]|nr:sulfatase-like hydrolase/transferase [Planctomycetales bacterium]
MKKLVWWVGWLVLVHAWAEGAERPNVVLFLIDDLGWADLELTGSTFYETPHVDALAAAGAFFSDAYAASPVCSPTRASIQTGKDPSRMGMSYLAGSRGPMGPGHMLVSPPVVGN